MFIIFIFLQCGVLMLIFNKWFSGMQYWSVSLNMLQNHKRDQKFIKTRSQKSQTQVPLKIHIVCIHNISCWNNCWSWHKRSRKMTYVYKSTSCSLLLKCWEKRYSKKNYTGGIHCSSDNTYVHIYKKWPFFSWAFVYDKNNKIMDL